MGATRREFLEQEDEPESNTPLASSAAVPAGTIPEGATHRHISARHCFYRAAGDALECWSAIDGKWVTSSLNLKSALLESPAFESLPRPADAPTEWQSGAPPSVGWWMTRRESGRVDMPRYFGGHGWGMCVSREDDPVERLACAAHGVGINPLNPLTGDKFLWRGPRLVGADWPEPQA